MSALEIKAIGSRLISAFPFYPILFGLYPVLALTAHNITQINLSSTYRPILLSAAFSIVLFGSLRLIVRSWFRAAMLVSLLLILFFSYGHVYSLLKNTIVLGFFPGRHRYFFPVWVGLAGLCVWMAARKQADFSPMTPALNVVSVLLLFFPLFQITQIEMKNSRQPSIMGTNVSPSVTMNPGDVYPDIYYIILDAYGRADILEELYDYDNSPFLDALAERGFYVAHCSQSNYPYTSQSLGSSLNLDYLDKFITTDYDNVYKLIRRNVVRQFLETRGYKIVAFETGFRWTQWEDADFYFDYKPGISALNNFEFLFLQTTLMRFPMDYVISTTAPVTYEAIHYRRIHYVLDTLKNLQEFVVSPKFVFVHLAIPHPPYVFGPDGELVPQPSDESGKIVGYRNAVNSINGEILGVIDRIMSTSRTQPVIIIQGDHGPFLYSEPYQHMAILNAYYLPGHEISLYPSITPVNTFRIVFNAYFGQEYPLLEDVSWYSPAEVRWNFEYLPVGCDD